MLVMMFPGFLLTLLGAIADGFARCTQLQRQVGGRESLYLCREIFEVDRASEAVVTSVLSDVFPPLILVRGLRYDLAIN